MWNRETLTNNKLGMPISKMTSQSNQRHENLLSGKLHYSHKNIIGAGSFGNVYRGTLNGKDVAIKEVVFRDDDTLRRSFNTELEILSKVKHDNIIRVYPFEHIEDKFRGKLVMEFSREGPLSGLLHDKNQSNIKFLFTNAISWALQVAKGVAFLHDLKPKPIMHRDLKPANLLLFEKGKIIKICDFGIASERKSTNTRDMGTVTYTAPEVFTDKYNESCDVYSWSIIFWETLTRKRPFSDADNELNIVYRVANKIRPETIEGCPDIIWSLITRSWDHETSNRPTMSEIVNEMQVICKIAHLNRSDKETSKSKLTLNHQDSCNEKYKHIKFIRYRGLLKYFERYNSYFRNLSELPYKDLHSEDGAEESKRLKDKLNELDDKRRLLKLSLKELLSK